MASQRPTPGLATVLNWAMRPSPNTLGTKGLTLLLSVAGGQVGAEIGQPELQIQQEDHREEQRRQRQQRGPATVYEDSGQHQQRQHQHADHRD